MELQVVRSAPAGVRPAEIERGLVIYMDQSVLIKCPSVHFSDYHQDAKKRPHLCLAANRGFSAWTTITSRDHPQRLYLLPEWRTGGLLRWQTAEDVFLYDGAFIICGPTPMFCTAADNVELLDRTQRARLTKEGLRECLSEVRRQARRRPDETTERLRVLGLSLAP